MKKSKKLNEKINEENNIYDENELRNRNNIYMIN